MKMLQLRNGYIALCVASLAGAPAAHAIEGARGWPISGTGVIPNVDVVPPEPVWLVNVGE